MANCERIGSHGKVSRVPHVECHCPAEVQVKQVDLAEDPLSGLLRLFSRVRLFRRDREDAAVAVFAHNVTDPKHRQFDEEDARWLGSSIGRMDRGVPILAMRVHSLIAAGIQGTDFADVLELLPPDLSVRLVLAASDPGISRSILTIPMGGLSHERRNQIYPRYDISRYAIEGFLLLPLYARHRIVGAMDQLPPATSTGRIWGVEKLLSYIIHDWNQHSSYSEGDPNMTLADLIRLQGLVK